MTNSNSIEQRHVVIGPYDQRPQIERVLAALPLDAPLRPVVDAHDDKLRAYELANDTASRAQQFYKRWGSTALVLTTIAALLSAATLFPIERHFPQIIALRPYVSGLQSAANIVALIIVWRLAQFGAIGRWMQSRAEAERLRGAYFRAIIDAPTPPAADARRLWSEKLTLLETAHLDYQRKYFASAEKRHRGGSSMLRGPKVAATIATGIGVLIGAAALAHAFKLPFVSYLLALLGEVLAEPTRWQIGLNTIASSLLAYASARAMVTQDERNAALYALTGQRLDDLRTPARREAVATAAAAGDGTAVIAYAEAAQSILDADHQAWMLNRPPVNPTAGPPPRMAI
ncbi:MAG: hypothetical protein KJS95_11935 [Gammaproteobacteria bacterium]|nr:hypothetical protein [Gammaproteobacteria bacterium]